MKTAYEKPMIEVCEYSVLPKVACGISWGDEYPIDPAQYSGKSDDIFI